jgi:hypothetical protein
LGTYQILYWDLVFSGRLAYVSFTKARSEKLNRKGSATATGYTANRAPSRRRPLPSDAAKAAAVMGVAAGDLDRYRGERRKGGRRPGLSQAGGR